MKPVTTALLYSVSLTNAMRPHLFVFILAGLVTQHIHAQKKIRLTAEDGLPVIADFYTGSPGDPYLLMFHQENSSRGEFREIGPRLAKMGFNCLAVDLRSGGEINYVINETAQNADSAGVKAGLADCLLDIRGAIRYALEKSAQPVILLGSSFSASLVLLEGKSNPDVQAVLAFSPGEFFRPAISVKDSLSGFDKPAFIAASGMEYPYVEELVQNIPDSVKRLYTPGNNEGVHGAAALWDTNPQYREYWLAVILFVRSITKVN